MRFQNSVFFIFFGMVLLAFYTSAHPIEKLYSKSYYSNGTLKAEGWKQMDIKTDYWIFYHENGSIASKGHFDDGKRNGYWYFYDQNRKPVKEGHYKKGSAENWWIFYSEDLKIEHRYQYKFNKKNGFALIYKNGTLIKAEKYKNDKKLGEWTSLAAFKKDNPNASL
ncbi:toxin-antitoxin system YwqK family antitoxin [Jejudonia soesokkakensis]|uniref:Toxin-antitoxin system YwqK family antitoxin n=1 Tax=Jejudonia soesokkakensis TaxID=1323432 RepID=A0ABW2MX58_9FLAO